MAAKNAKRMMIFGLLSLGIGLCGMNCSADHTPKVCFQTHCFTVEIADTLEKQTRGLQLRQSMANNAGMLFIFPSDGIYSFWMKDTWIPLDMIWLDKDYRVVHIEHDVPPCASVPCLSYGPKILSRYVLELNAGMARKIGLIVGDEMILRE